LIILCLGHCYNIAAAFDYDLVAIVLGSAKLDRHYALGWGWEFVV
jgi:hypothetical protein